MSTRAVARELNVHFSTISILQHNFRIWQYFKPTSTADHVYGVVCASGCEQSAPWWVYSMGRHTLRTTNTIAFYRWQFERTEIPWRDPEARSRAIHPPPSPHVSAYCTTHVARICTQFLEDENVSYCPWPLYSPGMSPIEHVWDALDWHVWQCSTSSHYPATSHSHGDNIPQATINSLINSMRRSCVGLHEANGGHTR